MIYSTHLNYLLFLWTYPPFRYISHKS